MIALVLALVLCLSLCACVSESVIEEPSDPMVEQRQKYAIFGELYTTAVICNEQLRNLPQAGTELFFEF